MLEKEQQALAEEEMKNLFSLVRGEDVGLALRAGQEKNVEQVAPNPALGKDLQSMLGVIDEEVSLDAAVKQPESPAASPLKDPGNPDDDDEAVADDEQEAE